MGRETAGEAGGRWGVILALASLYLVWGSTYLAIRFALESFGPMTMIGLRFLAAGGSLYLWLRARGEPSPDRGQWLRSGAVGLLLLVGGTGGVTVAEQWVASGLAALAIGAVPLWAVIFSGLWGHRSSRLEWLGLALGLAGVVLLNLEGDFRAKPLGAAVLLLASLSWSFGSVWSRRLRMPAGLMSAAAQMLIAGALTLPLGLALDGWPGRPTAAAGAALLYLVFFGSLVGFSAYLYLLGRVGPALATSYAWVNPLVAVALGHLFGGERLGAAGFAAMPLILAGVVLVALRGGGRGR